jgi:hypothetical protein
VPDPHATLRRLKTRFNSWRGHFPVVTLEPDGTAAACKAARSGFDSRRCLLRSNFKQGQTGRVQRRATFRGIGQRCAFRTWNRTRARRPPPVSSVDRAPDQNLAVAGSTPVPQRECENSLQRRRVSVSGNPEGNERMMRSARAPLYSLRRVDGAGSARRRSVVRGFRIRVYSV